MITFVCWKWKAKYRTTFTAEHANIWNASLRRNYNDACRTICITDDPAGIDFETFPLWKDCGDLFNPSGAHLPSCYRRLKIFSPLATSEMDIEPGSPVVSLDLDVVFVRNISPMFQWIEDFKGWRGPGSFNPIVYNGTMLQFRAGKMSRLWDDFDPLVSPGLANKARYFGSDQGWLSFKLAGTAPGWGSEDGIFSYTSDMRNDKHLIPASARIISFNGKTKPWDAPTKVASPWINDHWRM